MSQSALEIWTVALIFATAFIAAGGFGIFYAQKRRAILLSIQQDKVKAHDKDLDEREEELGIKTSLFEQEKKRMSHVYSWVTFGKDEAASLGFRLPAITRKKLAQRIGYRILQRFNGEVKEVEVENGRQFRLDLLVSPKK